MAAIFALQQAQHIVVAQLRGSLLRNHILIIDETRGVREQMADDHSVCGIRQGRQPSAYRVVDRKPPLLRQQQHRGRRELLAHGRETVVGRRAGGDAALHIGKSVGTLQDGRSVPQYGEAGTGYGALIIVHEVVDLLHGEDLRHG